MQSFIVQTPLIKWEHGIWADKAWDNKGNIVIGNDVWIGYEAVILAGVTIGDGAIIGAEIIIKRKISDFDIRVCYYIFQIYNLFVLTASRFQWIYTTQSRTAFIYVGFLMKFKR